MMTTEIDDAALAQDHHTMRQKWSAPTLSIVRIADVTNNSASTGTDGKGGPETGATAS